VEEAVKTTALWIPSVAKGINFPRFSLSVGNERAMRKTGQSFFFFPVLRFLTVEDKKGRKATRNSASFAEDAMQRRRRSAVMKWMIDDQPQQQR
jgi:hypothetical protein